MKQEVAKLKKLTENDEKSCKVNKIKSGFSKIHVLRVKLYWKNYARFLIAITLFVL